MKIAIIAAYNEEDTIGTIVIKTKKHVDRVIVVDDGSTDKTSEIAKTAGAIVIQHLQNGGKGAALKKGFEAAEALHPDVVVCLDADAQHDPDDIPDLMAPILKGDAAMVIGSRFIEKEHKKEIPLYRRLGQWVLTATTNCSSEEKITDSQSGFRAFSGDVLDRFSFNQSGFSIETEMLKDAAECRIKVTEVPISMRYRGLDTSTETPGKHGFGVLNYILKIVMEKRPLLFFGLSGMIFLIFGLLFGLYSLNFYFMNHFVPFGPSLVAAVLILIGVLSVFAGMILNSIALMIQGQGQKDQHREEMLLKSITEKIAQKPVQLSISGAEALVRGFERDMTPESISSRDHYVTRPVGTVNRFPGMAGLRNPKVANVNTNNSGDRRLGLTYLDNIDNEIPNEDEAVEDTSAVSTLSHQGGDFDSEDDHLMSIYGMNGYYSGKLPLNFNGKKYRI